MAELEFFEDKSQSKQNHRFRVKAANGEILATSEGYSNESKAREGAQTLHAALMDIYMPTGE